MAMLMGLSSLPDYNHWIFTTGRRVTGRKLRNLKYYITAEFAHKD